MKITLIRLKNLLLENERNKKANIIYGVGVAEQQCDMSDSEARETLATYNILLIRKHWIHIDLRLYLFQVISLFVSTLRVTIHFSLHSFVVLNKDYIEISTRSKIR